MKIASSLLSLRIVQLVMASLVPLPFVSPQLSVADNSTSTTSGLSVLNSPEFRPEDYTRQQLRDLMVKWEQSEKAKREQSEEARAISVDRIKEIYTRLGDESYAVREAASSELLSLGSAVMEALVAITEGEADLEKAVRANRIIATWKEERSVTPNRIQKIFRVWKALPHGEQLRHSKFLVAMILQLPEEVSLPLTDRGLGHSDYLDPRFPRERTVRLRDELLRSIASQLASHETPEADAILVTFLRETDEALLLQTITLIGSPRKGCDVAPELIRLAEQDNKAVALHALSHLSNWHGTSRYRGKITTMLKRLYKHKDEEIALQAAIISCYSGDWSGFPMLLEATKDPNKVIARKAVGQLVDGRFRGRAEQVVPLLIPHLKTDDLQLLNRTIETLGSYPSSAKYVIPFLKHEDKHIVWRAILALTSMQATEAIPALKELQSKTTDETTLQYLNDALLYIGPKNKP